ncbi:MAG: DnaJ domain-containing protein, partial [Nocardioides sp.]
MSTPTPSWYDVLGVAPEATVDQIRAAWKSGIAELDPGDRRFRSLNSAAEVLLDADRRAAHDRDLAVEESEQPEAPADEPPWAIEPAIAPVEVPASRVPSAVKDSPDFAKPARSGASARLTALLGDLRTVVLLAVVALALVAATLVTTLQDDDAPDASGALPDSREIAAARAAAEAAIGPVLSYDYRQLD